MSTYVNSLINIEHCNHDYDPGINAMFLNNLDPTLYAMQMQNSDVLTHAHMKGQVEADTFVEAQTPEIDRLSERKAK
jgi:hypothetical protein